MARKAIINKSMFTASRTDWETPAPLFNQLNNEFKFTLDVCATPQNAKCPQYFTPQNNGLAQTWKNHVCWMNPPYGRIISKWMEKAYNERKHATIVCLIPSRTDTQWWHEYAMKGQIRYIRGRLRFSNSNTNAPFPCAIIIYTNQHQSPTPGANQ